MQYLILLFLIFTIACSSQPKQETPSEAKVEVIVPQPHPEKRSDARVIYFEKEYRGNELDPILQSVATKINEKTYVLSSVLSPNVQVRRDKAIHFIEKTEDLKPNKNNLVKIRLEKNNKYLSYKLSITYHDKRGREKKRNWLFSLNYDNEQIEKSVHKTIIRFAFQSL